MQLPTGHGLNFLVSSSVTLCFGMLLVILEAVSKSRFHDSYESRNLLYQVNKGPATAIEAAGGIALATGILSILCSLLLSSVTYRHDV
ncbi:hypothetical protein GQ43DRAFT_440634 [Delitschia confertaspora ATCC 74209]|uniref:Uncharacterized protein n=1 Tax=Delitschia confertaspora ATCC 74209 TaxID=1513339 RepID=A0A9P4JNF4_9PLEO|nr:hypothetical protein GQ43DRAFT_440634 [Delitschia confertaspora ATCC 74209]